MKHLITKNQYKTSNCYLDVTPDLSYISAYSYGWWQFVAIDKVGNIVFNDTSYSNSTSNHQGAVRTILRRLGLNISITLRNTRSDMGSNISGAIDMEIKAIEYDIADIKKAMEKPRTHKRKNLERLDSIKDREYRIADLKRYRDEYIDKKLIPVKKDKYSMPVMSTKTTCYHNGEKPACSHCKKDRLEGFELKVKEYESYNKYFLKPNGVVQKNELETCLSNISSYSLPMAPDSLEKITQLLDLKQKDIQKAVEYQFINDTENMIPQLDTKEYEQLQKLCKKHEITRDTLNNYQLDKIHTFLLNKINNAGKTSTPREPKAFPIADKVAKLEGTPDLTIIKNDVQLRAEGRKQSHCIGGKAYINECIRGNHALNYKGYTFYLDSTASRCLSTTGKHNCHTPWDIKNELAELLGWTA